jgi:tetratricopeptide (TPR) repeat protein
VRLTSGRVVVELDPQPTGSSFSVVTDVVKVTAIGTVFTVEVPDPATSAVLVRVLEGTVAVEPKHGPVMRLSAPGAVKVARSVEPTPLVATDAARDWELLGKPVVTPTATANEAERTAPVSTARELLDKARVLRAQGRFTEAANAYARLRTSHPRSKEAHVALLSMGELQLSHLGNASAALRWFQTYVDAGGPLVQEARYGKIRALRQLGRTAQEKREIQRFLSDYPHSVQTPGLRARAGEL